MTGVGMYAGADDGQLVHDLGLQRQMFADFDAMDVGANRLELAAEFRWRSRFQIVSVDMARVRLLARRGSPTFFFIGRPCSRRGGIATKQIDQRQPAKRQATDAQRCARQSARLKLRTTKSSMAILLS